MEENVSEQAQPTVHDFNNSLSSFSFNRTVYLILAAAAILGILAGFLISKGKTGGLSTATTQVAKSGSIQQGAAYGSNDTNTFKDTASGIMKKGGIDGEGEYHLVRPGGDSQNVYLTSSIVDLSLFIDRKVKVWGQTQKAKVAGWLMDVGRVEVLE